MPHDRELLLHRTLACGMIFVTALGVLAWSCFKGTNERKKMPELPASYIGAAACAPCHSKETEAWRQSHHAQSMQQADSSTVLGGGFNGSNRPKDETTYSLYVKAGKFFVSADGPDGRLHEYPVAYTFGLFPLQQYLIPFAKGRLQSFVLAWDSRSKAQGGQRWFYLYPGRALRYTDPLHWTGRNQTWNYMCADCHSTGLRKNYDLSRDNYATTWSEMNVACEACHGPASNHVAWAQSHKEDSYGKGASSIGLVVDFKSGGGSWFMLRSSDSTLHWKGSPRSRAELEVCAPCHSRRHSITNNYRPGQPFLDAYVPSLLDEGVYYPDGQILEEDYEYGSFVQSKMYGSGVTCSDCHDPHSGKLAEGNHVCGRCHMLSKFGSTEHHHHTAGNPGGLCANCHMPTRTYMVIDVRRDHSLRIPRPDFSLIYKTPNACTQCHRNKSDDWALEKLSKWYGPGRRQERHFAEAIDAGRRGTPNAERLLTSLIADSGAPSIARATALSLLPPYFTSSSVSVVQAALRDADPLVRMEAVKALEPLPPQDRLRLLVSLLTDPIRPVRIESARLLAGTSSDSLQSRQKAALDRATAELVASEMASAERPENHMNLASLYDRMARASDAESELLTALRLDPNFVPAMVNLADLYREQGRDDEGEHWLEKAIGVAPEAAEPIYALGLLKVRQKQYPEALELLARAAKLQPGNTRYSYVYATALQSGGEIGQAIAVLEQAHNRRPADREILTALIAFEREKGNLRSAISYAQQLIKLVPDDTDAKMLLGELLRQGK